MIRAILTCLMVLLGSARAAEVHAELSTDTVEAGQGALLSLKIEGGAPEALNNIIATERVKWKRVIEVSGAKA